MSNCRVMSTGTTTHSGQSLPRRNQNSSPTQVSIRHHTPSLQTLLRHPFLIQTARIARTHSCRHRSLLDPPPRDRNLRIWIISSCNTVPTRTTTASHCQFLLSSPACHAAHPIKAPSVHRPLTEMISHRRIRP